MKIKKILKYFFSFLFLSIVVFYLFIFYDYNTPYFICRYVEDEQDYQKKLILAENNSTMLADLILYNNICTKNDKEAQRLFKKLEELEQNMSK